MSVKIKQAKIPEKLKYFYNAVKYYNGIHWENQYSEQTIKVNQLLVADANDKSSVKSTEKKYKNSKFNSIEVENKPFNDLKLLNIEHQNGNKGSYFEAISNNYLIEVSKDVALDALQNCTITNGLVKGEFVWAKIATRLKLVRVGSELHTAVLTAEVRNKKPILKKTTFEPGSIYLTRDGDYSMFLGYANSTYTSSKLLQAYKTVHNRDYYGYDYYDNSAKPKAKFDFDLIPQTNLPVFILLDCNNDQELPKKNSDIILDIKNYQTAIYILDKNTFVEKVSSITIERDYFAELREVYRDYATSVFLNYTGANKTNYSVSGYNVEYNIEKNSIFANMYDQKKSSVKPINYEKFELFA